MKYGIISDIHSNFEALEAVLENLRSEEVDQYIFVGDIVGYGANPIECIEKIVELNPIIVAGNHDFAATGQTKICTFNSYAADAVLWTQKKLTHDALDYLSKISLVEKRESFSVVHGSLSISKSWEYLSYPDQFKNHFNLQETPLCFVGHTHVPLIMKKKNDNLQHIKEHEIYFEKDAQYCINVGSVGQPRDGNPKAAYGIFDDQKNFLQLNRTVYDIEKAQVKIKKSGLPELLASRLSLGQ